jgi:uncharacterized membrane protein YphA (DoxX/SURF4 family)
MNLRTGVRVLIAISFLVSGLVETLGATGLVVELSPAHRWGPGVHTLAVSGPLLMVGAALLASGRKTRWVLSILGCYVFLVSALGDLPLIANAEAGASAIVELLINLAVMGGILYWFYSGRKPSASGAKPALLMANPAPDRTTRHTAPLPGR